MFHIPAHKDTKNPPGQYFYPPLDEDEPIHEVREPDPPPYKVEDPDQPDT